MKHLQTILLSLFLLASGCLMMDRPEINWHLTLNDAATKQPLAGCAVTLVLRGFDANEERFGPVLTDSNGLCVITVPAQKRRLSSFSKDAFKLWLEVRLDEQFLGIAEPAGSDGTSDVFELRRGKKPNQALEPTRTSVTSPASAGAAPAARVAHL